MKEEKSLSELKDEFNSILQDTGREGMTKLLQYLDKSDFFSAPASTKYHEARTGGLLRHSMNVYHRIVRLLQSEIHEGGFGSDNVTEIMQSAAIVSLLHDVCKTNFYTVSSRNVKDENGQWKKVPYYSIRDDRLGFGHGEESVYIIQSFFHLTREEAFAIRFHMGDFTDFNTCKAFAKYPLATLLHMADLSATYIDEETPPQN